MIMAHIAVHGIVQGVFFRSATRRIAEQPGVNGYVRNMPDGSVEVVAEGNRKGVEQLIRFCKKGPEGAVVERVQARYGKPTKRFTGFEVR